jgi:UPF0716 protein FxsA
MLPRLILAGILIGVPLLEIVLFIKIGGAIGTIPSVFIVVFTAVLGALLLRHQGFFTMQKLQDSMQRGEFPALVMLESVFFFIAAVLLLIPGFFTDTIGALLLIPPVRKVLVSKLSGFQQFGPPPGGPGGPSEDKSGSRVIEGEYKRDDD